MDKITIKTPEEFQIMKEGGLKLKQVKTALFNAVKIGVKASDLDNLAEKMIKDLGGVPSFKMVHDYAWSICVNINQGVVHGIPSEDLIFKPGDLVSVDLGMLYKGFHTDTSFSLDLNGSEEVKKFLNIGRQAFQNAVSAIKPDNSYIYDISKAIEDTLKKSGYSPILDLTGHGIGKNLHENPYVPCFTEGLRIESPKIIPGMALAIEVMYCQGKPDLVKENDGWTIVTEDAKIAGLFEDTIIITEKGYEIIT